MNMGAQSWIHLIIRKPLVPEKGSNTNILLLTITRENQGIIKLLGKKRGHQMQVVFDAPH